MPPRPNHRAEYNTQQLAAGQQSIDFDAEPEQPKPPAPHIEESAPAAYSFKDGYRNPYKRVVDWVILDPHGTELATVKSKKGAKTLIGLLNEKDGQQR